MNNKTLIPISLNELTTDMIFPCDIYGGVDGRVLILKKGNTLTEPRIKQLHSHHGNHDGLFVTEDNVQVITSFLRGYDMGEDKEIYYSPQNYKRQKLEKETGFSEIKEVTQDLFKPDNDTVIIQKDKTLDISAEISHRLEVTRPDLIVSLVNMLVPVDEYLQSHIVNVSTLNGIMGKWLGLPRRDVILLVLVGLLHDCGKDLIPPEVLNAPRQVSRIEFEVIKMHTIYGYNLLEGIPEIIRNAVRSHHEKLSGRGYPDMLAQNEVSMLARITAVSDVYDAMVSRRVYKNPQSPFHVMARLKELTATDLDPFVVNTFTTNMPKELIGKSALMSNGKTGIVEDVDSDDLEFPYVRIDGELVKTDEQLFCQAMGI